MLSASTRPWNSGICVSPIPGFLSGTLSVKDPAADRKVFKKSPFKRSCLCCLPWVGGCEFQLRTTTFDSWSFFSAEVSSGFFFLLGLKMSLPCDGHQCFDWTKEVRGSLCFVIMILPIQVKLVLPSPMKGPRNKSHFNIFHEIRVVDDGDAHDYK